LSFFVRLENLARDKRSSLLLKFVNYRLKNFYNIVPAGCIHNSSLSS
jgi:hypothetical protein